MATIAMRPFHVSADLVQPHDQGSTGAGSVRRSRSYASSSVSRSPVCFGWLVGWLVGLAAAGDDDGGQQMDGSRSGSSGGGRGARRERECCRLQQLHNRNQAPAPRSHSRRPHPHGSAASAPYTNTHATHPSARARCWVRPRSRQRTAAPRPEGVCAERAVMRAACERKKSAAQMAARRAGRRTRQALWTPGEGAGTNNTHKQTEKR